MASCVVNVLVFLFSLTQIACTALRSASTRPYLPALVFDPFAELSDAKLLDEVDGVGVVVADAATAAVPAPPMTAATAPATAMVFHMMCSLVHCSVGWSYVDWGSPLNRSCAGHSVARGGSRGGGRCWAGARSLQAVVAAPCVAGVILSAAGSGPGRDRRRVGVLAGRPVRGCVNGDG